MPPRKAMKRSSVVELFGETREWTGEDAYGKDDSDSDVEKELYALQDRVAGGARGADIVMDKYEDFGDGDMPTNPADLAQMVRDLGDERFTSRVERDWHIYGTGGPPSEEAVGAKRQAPATEAAREMVREMHKSDLRGDLFDTNHFRGLSDEKIDVFTGYREVERLLLQLVPLCIRGGAHTNWGRFTRLMRICGLTPADTRDFELPGHLRDHAPGQEDEHSHHDPHGNVTPVRLARFRLPQIYEHEVLSSDDELAGDFGGSDTDHSSEEDDAQDARRLAREGERARDLSTKRRRHRFCPFALYTVFHRVEDIFCLRNFYFARDQKLGNEAPD